MSDLTEATKLEAMKLYIPVVRTERVDYYVYSGPNCIQSIIDFLTPYTNEQNPIVTLDADDYSGTNRIIIDFVLPRSEEEVRKEIRRRINLNNIRDKALKKEALPKAERIAWEIKELEKKLAREKKKLEKL